MTIHLLLRTARALLGLVAAFSGAAGVAAGVLWVLDGSRVSASLGGLAATTALALVAVGAILARRALGVPAARAPERAPQERAI